MQELPVYQTTSQIPTHQYDYALKLRDDTLYQYRLELHCLSQRFSPLLIDFSTGSIAHRLHYGGGRKQAIGRAVGLQKNKSHNIIDATAGLGRDAIVLANLGCHVLMIERNPILNLLLQDALRRLNLSPQWNTLSGSLELVFADSHSNLSTFIDKRVDCIYLDPMYPHRNNSALVKKEMRILRDIVGDDIDAASVLETALKSNTRRVVVKRPIHAPILSNHVPHHIIKSKNTRFDVYSIKTSNEK